VAAAAGRLFAVDGGTLYAVDPDSGGWQELTSGWRPRAMVGVGDHLYLFEDSGSLCRVAAGTGEYEDLAGGWSGISAAAATGGHLFAVASGSLYEIDPATGAHEDLGGGWTTDHLVGLGPHLFAFESGGTLYRVYL